MSFIIVKNVTFIIYSNEKYYSFLTLAWLIQMEEQTFL